MTDFLGNDIKIGDFVVIKYYTYLHKGIVCKLTKSTVSVEIQFSQLAEPFVVSVNHQNVIKPYDPTK